MPTTARATIDDALGRGMTREIWSGNYAKALPLTVQDFDLTAVLPAVFYMFRRGYRRGQGHFLEAFANEVRAPKSRRQAVTIDRIANKLAETPYFDGFDGEVQRAILGDLLLASCLENSKRALGRTEQVQRVAPAHYMASWIDLPERVVHLRYVPEMIVAMLADRQGETVDRNQEGDRTWFAVGAGFEENLLLKAFHQGVVREGKLGDQTSDRFQEETTVGLDQLLMIRLAQQVGAPPDKLRGADSDRISNQRPIAEQAAQDFSEDIRHFVRAYSNLMPRHAFVEMLEACMAVGLATIVTSVIELLFQWAGKGEIPPRPNQHPTALFMDCSNGVDRQLQRLSEQSMDDFLRRIERFPIVLMALRLLDYGARYDREIRKLNVRTYPYATEWINLLGDLLHQRRKEADRILYELDHKAQDLADRLEEEYPEAAGMLRNDQVQPNPVWRMAEALTLLQGRKSTQNNVVSLIDSACLINRPNGLTNRRTVLRRSVPGQSPKKRDVRSLVCTDAVVDYLVHLHVLRTNNKPGNRSLSLKRFIQILRERYGFYLDVAPPGVSISNELLRVNRTVLERRLRDLGLLVGVNDAESMKYLAPRFERAEVPGVG